MWTAGKMFGFTNKGAGCTAWTSGTGNGLRMTGDGRRIGSDFTIRGAWWTGCTTDTTGAVFRRFGLEWWTTDEWLTAAGIVTTGIGACIKGGDAI